MVVAVSKCSESALETDAAVSLLCRSFDGEYVSGGVGEEMKPELGAKGCKSHLTNDPLYLHCAYLIIRSPAPAHVCEVRQSSCSSNCKVKIISFNGISHCENDEIPVFLVGP